MTLKIGIMEEKREIMREEFLKLAPIQRIKMMNKIFNDIISLKAKIEGVSEYEIYRRYLNSRQQYN